MLSSKKIFHVITSNFRFLSNKIAINSFLFDIRYKSSDAEEISYFDNLSMHWADESGPFRALHAFNRIRIPWLVGTIGDRSAVSYVSLLLN